MRYLTIAAVIRLMATTVMLIGVYFETGWFTAATLGMITIAVEILAYKLPRNDDFGKWPRH